MSFKNMIKDIQYIVVTILNIFGNSEWKKTCPCCGHIGKFKTSGQPPRYGSKCPRCESLERHRLMFLANEQYHFFDDRHVLHFAPEQVVTNYVKKRAAKYLSADLSNNRADTILNIEAIDLPDETWDVVICSHVLEHVDDNKSLQELYRVLKTGGILILMIPIIEGWECTYENPAIVTEKDREKHFGQADHVRWYGKDVRERVTTAGFCIEKEYTCTGEDAVNYGLLRGEKVFICRK